MIFPFLKERRGEFAARAFRALTGLVKRAADLVPLLSSPEFGSAVLFFLCWFVQHTKDPDLSDSAVQITDLVLPLLQEEDVAIRRSATMVLAAMLSVRVTAVRPRLAKFPHELRLIEHYRAALKG
jgi:hypothetical protein